MQELRTVSAKRINSECMNEGSNEIVFLNLIRTSMRSSTAKLRLENL